MPYPDIIVVGVAAIDLVVKVDQLPRPDDLVLTQKLDYFPGGSGANVAVALSQLGCAVGFIGKLGDDEYGRRLMRDLEENGVDIRPVVIEEGKSTPSCFIAVDGQGNRVIFALGGTIIDKVEDLEKTFIQHAKILFLSDVDGDVVRFAALEAHRAGAFVFYCPGGIVASRGLANLETVLDEIDVLVVSESEMNKLYPGETSADHARELIRRCGGMVVQTLGSKGVRLVSATQEILVPAVRVAKVVDSTGAGDAFVAGLIASRLNGKAWEHAAMKGCAVAAIKLGFPGARAKFPKLDKLPDFE